MKSYWGSSRHETVHAEVRRRSYANFVYFSNTGFGCDKRRIMINAQLTSVAMICCINNCIGLKSVNGSGCVAQNCVAEVGGATPSHVMPRINSIYYFNSNKRIDLFRSGRLGKCLIWWNVAASWFLCVCSVSLIKNANMHHQIFIISEFFISEWYEYHSGVRRFYGQRAHFHSVAWCDGEQKTETFNWQLRAAIGKRQGERTSAKTERSTEKNEEVMSVCAMVIALFTLYIRFLFVSFFISSNCST